MQGCRQGDPLSLLLLIMAIERLARAVRAHKNITGLSVGNHEHCIALYADNVIILTKDLQVYTCTAGT